MFQLATYASIVLAVIVTFFSPIAGWALVLLVCLGFLFMLWSVWIRRPAPIPELSIAANTLFQKYAHYYRRPFAGADCSGSCSALAFGGIAIGIVSCFKSFWLGIPLAAITYITMCVASRSYNPTNYLSASQMVAHREVFLWLKCQEIGSKLSAISDDAKNQL